MKPVRKNNLAELAAEQVLVELRRGTWTGRLPGVRVLSAWLQISPPTLGRALKLLVDRGVLEDTGPRRRYRILEEISESPSPGAVVSTGRRHLLILTHHALELTANSTRGIIERIVASASANGWTIGYEIMDFFNARRPRKSWDESVAAIRPDAMIGVFGRPVLADWAVASGHRMLFLGGISHRPEVPVYSVKVEELLRPALRRLMEAGHRRICFPLCERADPFSERLSRVVAEEFAAAGLPFSARLHVPITAYSGPDVIASIVTQRLGREGITGWIFLDWREYVSAQGIFHRAGLKIPDDVSVIVLIGEPVATWSLPTLSRFELPADALARQVLHWLEHPYETSAGRSFPATWIEGESIAPPPEG